MKLTGEQRETLQESELLLAKMQLAEGMERVRKEAGLEKEAMARLLRMTPEEYGRKVEEGGFETLHLFFLRKELGIPLEELCARLG